jgi:hypothetical protein
VKLIRYEAACKALAECRRVDEVKAIRNLAEQMQLYAKQSNNQVMLADSTAILRRAVRRLGEVIEEQKQTFGLATGTRGQLSGGAKLPRQEDKPTLAEQGIDKVGPS